MTSELISPIKAYIKEEFLYNLELNSTKLLPCIIIGVSSYIGSPITFTIIVSDNNSEYIFSDIPLKALSPIKQYDSDNPPIIDNDILSYLRCPSEKIDIFELNLLKIKKINYFIPITKEWQKVEYLFSIEFMESNELIHLVKSSNNFLFAPNHKLSINTTNNFPKYKKNRQQW